MMAHDVFSMLLVKTKTILDCSCYSVSRYEIYLFMSYALLAITELPNNELTSIHTLNLPPLLL